MPRQIREEGLDIRAAPRSRELPGGDGTPVRAGSRGVTGGSGRRGFALVELLLVTVVLGLVATIVSPYVQRARERDLVTRMEADARDLARSVEIYTALNEGTWPTSVEEVREAVPWTPAGDVAYCRFVPVPGSARREPYFMAVAGHPGTTMKVFVAHPLRGPRIIVFDSGQRGC